MRSARKLLLPFSLLYGAVTRLRNRLYDRDLLKSGSFDLPVIGVGNLSVGGTGKSPMVEYLISLLQERYRVATLSRGYKRTTSGFHLVEGNEKASAVGDEPLQFKSKFPRVIVAVDEVRAHGIARLLEQRPKPQVILLDDAFQHRAVKPGLNILLTPYRNLYVDDRVLPAGNLREPASGAKRAQVVVVTKCPAQLTPLEKERVAKKLRLRPGQELFFTTVVYSDKVFGETGSFPLQNLKRKKVTLVTGIANPQPLVEFLIQKGLDFDHLNFPDHHNFKASELEEINREELVLTTEKDFMRLQGKIPGDKLFYLPISIAFVGDRDRFDGVVRKFVRGK